MDGPGARGKIAYCHLTFFPAAGAREKQIGPPVLGRLVDRPWNAPAQQHRLCGKEEASRLAGFFEQAASLLTPRRYRGASEGFC
jgi:hypothetical protein